VETLFRNCCKVGIDGKCTVFRNYKYKN
jgi:hypothetical protein